MLFENIKLLDENFEVQDNMYVGVADKRIAYIGTEKPQQDFGETYDGRGKLLMPGFYNGHGHSPMTLMRGYGENLTLHNWLNQRIFPFEDHLDSNAVYWGTLLAMAESLRFGIVSTNDMYFFIDDMVAAIKDSGAKTNVCRSIVQFDNSDPWTLPSMAEMKRTFEAYHNMEDGRIKLDTCIHAEYTSTIASIKAVVDYAHEVGTGFQVHVSETKVEHEECKARHNGMTPVQLFNSLGGWDGRALAAHCVWVEGEDFNILKEKGVHVGSNPISNLKLSSGVCNVPKMLEMGINVSIGTDSVASNNSLNFFEEMKTFAIASKCEYKDPTAVTPKQALYAATRAGALSQGREDCGLVKEGFRADLIVVNIDQPHMRPVHTMQNNLVYSASGSDVVLTMVDGKVLYDNGCFKTIDVEKTCFEVEAATQKILAAL